MQLTGPADVKAAHAYFQPTGAEAHLPAISGLAGADASAVHVAGHLAGKATEGAALSMATKAGEGAAMTAAHQAGAQVVSPLIQMIMRMPGHLGLMTSFFEALGHFFLGQDILGGLSETAHLLTQQAEGAMHAISAAAEHMGIHVELFPQDGDSLLNTMASATGETHGALLTANSEFASTLTKASVLDTSNMAEVGHNALNASGYGDLTQGQMERISSSMNDGSQPAVEGNDKFLAWDTGSAAFRPTLSGVQQPLTSAQMPQTTPTTEPSVNHADPSGAAQHPQHAAGHEVAKPHHDVARSAHHAGGRGKLLESGNETAQEPSGETQSDAAPDSATSDATQNGSDAGTADGAHSDAPTHEYTVQHGDNLWDIARTHLGDANRWTEIYHLNQDVLGDNPALIHAGTNLHLPGSDNIASGDYVVKSGDNLWDISQSHLGAGQHWTEVYHANETLIGSNPSLIHPGQHLTLSTDAASQHLASAPDAHAHSISHAAAAAPHAHHVVAQAHHAAAPAHHLAQAGTAPTHQVAESLPTHGLEHAATASPSVAPTEAAPATVATQGLHAQAGSLASLQAPTANPAAKFENLSAE
jgi:LysM repeat protein